jgi:hypothetical protein
MQDGTVRPVTPPKPRTPKASRRSLPPAAFIVILVGLALVLLASVLKQDGRLGAWQAQTDLELLRTEQALSTNGSITDAEEAQRAYYAKQRELTQKVQWLQYEMTVKLPLAEFYELGAMPDLEELLNYTLQTDLQEGRRLANLVASMKVGSAYEIDLARKSLAQAKEVENSAIREAADQREAGAAQKMLTEVAARTTLRKLADLDREQKRYIKDLGDAIPENLSGRKRRLDTLVQAQTLEALAKGNEEALANRLKAVEAALSAVDETTPAKDIKTLEKELVQLGKDKTRHSAMALRLDGIVTEWKAQDAIVGDAAKKYRDMSAALDAKVAAATNSRQEREAYLADQEKTFMGGKAIPPESLSSPNASSIKLAKESLVTLSARRKVALDAISDAGASGAAFPSVSSEKSTADSLLAFFGELDLELADLKARWEPVMDARQAITDRFEAARDEKLSGVRTAREEYRRHMESWEEVAKIQEAFNNGEKEAAPERAMSLEEGQANLDRATISDMGGERMATWIGLVGLLAIFAGTTMLLWQTSGFIQIAAGIFFFLCLLLIAGTEYWHAKSFDKSRSEQALPSPATTARSAENLSWENWEVKQLWDQVNSDAAHLRNSIPGPLK